MYLGGVDGVDEVEHIHDTLLHDELEALVTHGQVDQKLRSTLLDDLVRLLIKEERQCIVNDSSVDDDVDQVVMVGQQLKRLQSIRSDCG